MTLNNIEKAYTFLLFPDYKNNINILTFFCTTITLGYVYYS